MVRTVGIGHQDFGQIISENIFYVDKTEFIREWWFQNLSVWQHEKYRSLQGTYPVISLSFDI